MDIVVRAAGEGDLEAINAIYNHYVRSSPVTFDVEPVSLDARKAWLDEHPGGRHPALVAVDRHAVIGFATSRPYRARTAYETSVETSVYVADGAVRRGAGTALYAALFDRLAGEDIHRAFAGIVPPNPPSVALHERFGFRFVGRFSEQGRKFGRYWTWSGSSVGCDAWGILVMRLPPRPRVDERRLRRADEGRALMAFSRRARRLLAALRAERRTLRQGFIALLLGTATAFVAGIALGSITDTLEALPGLIILIPAAIGMRGTIFGAMGARLGTSTHAGVFEVTFARSGVLYQNLFVAVILTFSSTLFLAALARLSAAVFGLRSISFLQFVTTAVVGGIIDSAILLAATVGLSVLAYRRGYDLDAVATPLITATADMVTIPVLFLATMIARIELANTIVAVTMIVVCLLATIRGVLTDLPLARRVLIEMAGVVALTPLLDILAGTVVEARIHRFVAFPALLVLVPPFVAVAGALGGILSSRLSSKLQLGVISPRGRPEAPAVLDAAITIVFGLVAFLAMGLLGVGYTAVSNTASPGVGVLVGGTLLAGILATLIAIPVSYYVAIVTTRFGLDPDNHAVPIITSVMDLSGVVCFLLVLSLFGVAAHV